MDEENALTHSEVSEEQTEMSVALDILCQGYVQSYIDFFYLVHKGQKNPTTSSGEQEKELEDDDGKVSAEEMLFLKDTLTSTEKARRCAVTPVLYENYMCLANHFQKKQDPKTSIYFHEKCLEIARLTNDTVGELEANHCLGLAHQSLKQYKEAIQYHERQFTMSKDQGLEARRTAGRELQKVYAFQAATLEAKRPPQLDEAILFHNKCLTTAQLIFDREAQDTTSYRLARAYVMKGSSQKAIDVLEPYIQSCKIQGNDAGQAQGYAVLSAAYIALKDSDNAVKYLEQCLTVSESSGNVTVQGQANRSLGVIYNNSGRFDNAVEKFKKYFEITSQDAASNANADLYTINVARSLVGMAGANALMNCCIRVIDEDIPGLLGWKCQRRGLEKNASVKEERTTILKDEQTQQAKHDSTSHEEQLNRNSENGLQDPQSNAQQLKTAHVDDEERTDETEHKEEVVVNPAEQVVEE